MDSYIANKKRDKMKYRTLQFVLHTSVWLAIFAMVINSALKEQPVVDAVIFTLYSCALFGIIFYLNYFVITKFLFVKKKYFHFASLIIIVLLVPVYLVRYTSLSWWLVDESTFSASLDIFSNTFFFLLFSTVIKGMETWVYNRQREAQREKEKLVAELNFLKLQINPHFLFNTLNNIYSLAYSGDQNAAAMIAKLSQILRYMLYDCRENSVPVEKEIELLENYIDLQALKFGTDRNVDIYAEGVLRDHKIAPLILITFLENAFKHSDLGGNEDGWIKLNLVVEGNLFTFSISNSISNLPKPESKSSGLGLANIQKQLDLIYPEKHNLKMERNQNSHKVILEIKLD